MSASLVGSEMCIRDSAGPGARRVPCQRALRRRRGPGRGLSGVVLQLPLCLLYTSDAADDM
eukprot:13540574-Alexandrium_andersonii.AAC.1